MGTELWARGGGDEGGSYWARSQPHFPPLPIWAGKERKIFTSPGLFSSWFGGGERRVAGPFLAPLGGLRKGWKEGRWPARLGLLGAKRGEGGVRKHGSLVAFPFCFPWVHSDSSFSWSEPLVVGEGPRSFQLQVPEKFTSWSTCWVILPGLVVWGCPASASQSHFKGGISCQVQWPLSFSSGTKTFLVYLCSYLLVRAFLLCIAFTVENNRNPLVLRPLFQTAKYPF